MQRRCGIGPTVRNTTISTSGFHAQSPSGALAGPILKGPGGGLPLLLVRRAAGLLLLAGLLWLLRDVAWGELWGTVRGARPGWVLSAVLLQAAIVVLWAGMWWCFAPAGVRLIRLVETVVLSSVALLVAPSLAGQATGAALLVRRCGLRWSAAASVITGEQVAEASAKLSVLLLALLFAPLSARTRSAVLPVIVVLVLVVLGVLLVGGLWRRAPAVLRARKPLASAISLALSIKLLEAFVLVAAQRSLGVVLPPSAILLLLALAVVGIAAGALVPIPGPVGAAEAVMAAGYVQLGLSLELSVALVGVHTAALLLPRLTGAAVVLLRARNRCDDGDAVHT